jgi:putative transposase
MRPDITLVSVLDLYCHWIAGGGVLDRLQAKLGRRHRRGIYSFVVVLWLMIWQRLHPRGTMSHAVQLLAQGAGRSLLTACKRVQEDRISTAPGGYCQAVKKMPKLVPEQVTRELVERLNRELVAPGLPGLPGPVYLVDGSSVPLPHTRKLARAYPPAPNQHGGGHWPILRLLVLHEVHSGLALHPQWGPMYGPAAVSEQRLAAQAFAQVPAGATILADRNFGVFSIAWEAQRRQLGVVVRLTKERAWKLCGGPITGALDLPMSWQPSRHDQPQGTPWPDGEALPGRLIAERVGRGKSAQWLYLFTTLSLSAPAIVEMYRGRWNVETDLRSLKLTLQLQRLRARSVAGMEKELLAGICAYNLVRVVMCLAARRVGRASRELSFTRVLDLVTDWRAGLRAGAPEAELAQSIERLMDWAAACLLPRRRKRRSYPRQVWGRGGTYPRRKTK